MEQNNKQGNNSSSMSSNTKHLLIAAAAIVVVIAIAIIVPHLKKSSPATPTTPAAAMTQTPAVAQANVTAQMAAWNAEISKYNGNMIVFAADCTATPITQTHKLGDSLLLVNNSNVAHVVKVGITTYSVGALHYKTAYLGTKGTAIVNCDARGDTASISVD